MNSLEDILKVELNEINKQIYLTEEKIQQSRKRKFEAADFGDFKENVAHSEAEFEIGMFSLERVQLDNKKKEIQNLINKEYKSSGYIGIKSYFECIREDTSEILKFYVVTSNLGGAHKGLIPINSFLGKAICGKKTGDRCVINTGVYFYVVGILKVI